MISTVIKQYDEDIEMDYLTVEYDDGLVIFVPKDAANRHYQEVLAWVAEGNEIGEPE